MAKLSNINGKFAVEDTGAIRFSDQTGTTGQILKSNGNSAPTWVDPNTVGTGPWLPLAGGVVSGPTTFQSSLTVGGLLTGANATFNGLMKLDAGGILQFAANTATPSMGVAIHRSAADTLNFVTASTNRLTINGSGTVDITATVSDAVFLRSSQATTTNVYITNTNATSNNTANLYFAPANNIAGSYIQSTAIEDFSSSANRTSDLRFAVRKDGTFNEAVIIDSSGNVGIGITSPSDYYADQLVVKCSSSENGITIVSNSTTDANYLMFADGTSGADRYRGQVKYNHQDNYMSFATDATERMRITSAGNVNIATPITNAFYGLSLQYNATDTAEFKVNQATGQIKIGGVATGYFPTFYSAGSERMRIDSSGNINIGTGAASDTYVRIYNASSGDITAGYQVYNGSNLDLNIYTNPLFGNSTFFSRETFSFNTSAGAKVKILNNGNVGIGITSPSQKLVVQADWNGSLSNNQQLQIQGNTDTTLQLRLGYDTTNDYAEIAAIKSGTSYKNLILNRGGANVGIGTTAIPSDLYTASGGGWKVLQIGQSSQIAAYGTDDEIAICQNTYLNSSGVFQAITSNVAGSSIILVDGKIYFKNASTSGTAQTTSTRMFIDTTGNVGIGTTSPVNFTSQTSLTIDGTSIGRVDCLAGGGGGGGMFASSSQLQVFSNFGVNLQLSSAANIDFVTGSTDRMHITSGGRVTINNKPNSGLGYAVLIDVGTGGTGDVGYQTLSQLNTNLAGASDIRFKKNIEIIPNAIEKIKTINGYTFDWDSENEDYNYSEKEGRDAGVIAQEIQKVLPEIVQIATVDRDEEGKSTSGKNYLSVDYKKIIPLLIQGIKEQETSIQELKARIKILENK